MFRGCQTLRRLIALLTIVLLATMANTSVAAAQVTETVAPAAPAPIVWHELTYVEPPAAEPVAPVPPTTTTIPGTTTTTTTTIDPALGVPPPSPSVPPGPGGVTEQGAPVPSTPVEPTTTTTTTTTTLPPTTTTLRKPGKPGGPGMHGGRPRPTRPDAAPTTTEPRAEEEEPSGATTTTEPFTMEPDVTTGEPPSPPPADPPSVAPRALPDPGITSLSLPYTGLDPRPVLALAFGLVAGGGLLSWRARRRPRHARGQ
jgi:hypothetical protein